MGESVSFKARPYTVTLAIDCARTFCQLCNDIVEDKRRAMMPGDVASIRYGLAELSAGCRQCEANKQLPKWSLQFDYDAQQQQQRQRIHNRHSGDCITYIIHIEQNIFFVLFTTIKTPQSLCHKHTFAPKSYLQTIMDSCNLATLHAAVLELELALPRDKYIAANRFFHGQISRQNAEQLLTGDGQFLVRESGTQRGQFVLSCRHKSAHLHFIIHEHPYAKFCPNDKTNLGHDRFSFEGPLFDSVHELITFYLERAEPITMLSGAIIREPIERNLPLEAGKLTQYYASNSPASLQLLLQEIDVKKLDYSLSLNINSDDDDQVFEDVPPICNSSSYLEQLQRGVSAIKMETNSLIDTSTWLMFDQTQQQLCRKVCQTITHTKPSLLARHLFKCNLAFLGKDFVGKSSNPKPCLLTSGLELMCLPIGKQIRQDIIIRHECLKYFVAVSILKAENEVTSCAMLMKWILIANKMVTLFGDFFAFGALMDGLCHEKVRRSSAAWQRLRAHHSKESFILDTLRNRHQNLINGNEQPATNTTLPYVIPLCHLIECNNIFSEKLLPQWNRLQWPEIVKSEAENHMTLGLNEFSLDAILKQISISSAIIDKLYIFEANASALLHGVRSWNSTLEELFETSFHLHFLFSRQTDIAQLNHEMFRELEEQLCKM